MEKLEPCALSAGMYNSAAIVENNMAVPQKIKCRITIWSRNSAIGYILQKSDSKDSNICIPMFSEILFMIA